MDLRDKGIQTQIRHIEGTTGQSFDELCSWIEGLGEVGHSARRTAVMERYGLSLMHSDTLVSGAAQRREARAGRTLDQIVADFYQGGKVGLAAIHQAFWTRISSWEGVEAVAKKSYVSLRVKKQFATLGPGTRGRFELGLNGRHLVGGSRLERLPEGQICHFRVYLTQVDEVDPEVLGWVQSAWEAAR